MKNLIRLKPSRAGVARGFGSGVAAAPAGAAAIVTQKQNAAPARKVDKAS